MRGGAAQFCPATPEPRRARRGNAVRAIFKIHRMRYLAIDYGEKRIGLALSDERGKLAFPLEILPNDGKIFEKLGSVIAQENISAIVIGETELISKEVNKFIQLLTSHFSLPVHRQREELTTKEARRYGVGPADSRAAALILQRHLDRR